LGANARAGIGDNQGAHAARMRAGDALATLRANLPERLRSAFDATQASPAQPVAAE